MMCSVSLPNPMPVFLTSPQVAARLEVSLRTVHRLVADGRLTPVQRLPGPNGAFLFRPRDIDRFVTRRKRGVA